MLSVLYDLIEVWARHDRLVVLPGTSVDGDTDSLDVRTLVYSVDVLVGEQATVGIQHDLLTLTRIQVVPDVRG